MKNFLLARLEVLLIFCISLTFFTVGLSHQEIIGFETRFYLFVLEMLRHGVSWFPTTYQVPYPDYPVFPTFIIYVLAKCCGHLNKFTAVLPTATAAAITTSLTFMLGNLYSRKFGWYAVFFLLLTNTFLMEARTISPDQVVVMVTTACFYLACSSSLAQRKLPLVAIIFLLLLGFCYRGPIGIVIPAGVLGIFYLLEKEFNYFLFLEMIALVLLIICSSVLFFLAYDVGGYSFMQDVIRMEVSGRLHESRVPWFFYFVESVGAYAVSYPLAILVCGGLLKQFQFPEKQFIKKLIGWVLVILVGLSIPAKKKIRYILGIAPPLALISAYLFILPHPSYYLLHLRKLVFGIFYVVPLLFLVLMGGVEYSGLFKSLYSPINFCLLAIFFASLQFIIILASRVKIIEGIVIGIAALSFVSGYILLVEPINLSLNKTRDFVLQVENLRHAANAGLGFYKENPDALPIKYLVDMPQEEIPIFINSEDELLQQSRSMYFITDKKDFLELKKGVRKLVEGKIGHDEVVVFSVGR